jgi:hypothetical protein
MLLFAHTGITLGAVWLPDYLLRHRSSSSIKNLSEKEAVEHPHNSFLSRFISHIRNHDYRIILIGSLLPDIIDKPTSLLFPELNHARGFAHTGLFALILLLLGLYFYIKRNNFSGIYLAFASIMHLIIDGMWQFPKILLWPLYGWRFEGFEMVSLNVFLHELYHLLLSHPLVIAFELAGFLILISFFIYLLKQNRIYVFLKTGNLD